MISHAPKQTVNELLNSLHASFGRNLGNADEITTSLFDKIDLNSRVIDGIRTILLKEYSVTELQQNICTDLLDEIFTDFSTAMYLLAVGLIVPARMSVRRAFELGVALVYMWDLPHEYWGWRECDSDLSFSNMITHLNSKGYLTYLAKSSKCPQIDPICDQAQFQSFYRKLSNTVHGKVDGLPPLSPERFAAEKNGINGQLELTSEVQNAIINLFLSRFPRLKEEIEKLFPHSGR